MHATTKLALGSMLLLLALLTPAPATSADQDVVDTVSAAQVAKLLGDLGYTGSEIDEDGDIFVRMQGYSVLMLIGSYDGVYIAMVSAFADTRATLESVNTWNQEKRFARAYLDGDGDPVVEAELDLAGGVTIARVKDFIQTFGRLSLPEFVQTVAVSR
ncbi:MAG: YbjN domain-containing protein [Pseudomonadales bacterium]|jgi:hypothetical protein|nr:YbjN domain-containing protein [Pseudomonadales bacterium]